MFLKVKSLLFIIFISSSVYSMHDELSLPDKISALRELYTAKKYQEDLEIVFADAGKNSEQALKVCQLSVNVLLSLDRWPIDREVPKILALGAAKAYGQLSIFSPFTLPVMDPIILPYLKDGRLSYSDIRTPGINFEFGEQYSRISEDSTMLRMMENGQIISHNYKINLPVYFNRLVGDFFGDKLLIGGGNNCECNKASERHPSDKYYTIDINNAVKPDMVAHACYIPHLQALPTERFGFIWFEHYTPGELMIEYKAFSQYFRIAKPGAVFFMQTNYFTRTNEQVLLQEKFVLEGLENLKLKMEQDFFTVADLSKKSEGNKLWYQMIIIKPFYFNGGPNLNGQQWAAFELEGNSLKKYRRANEQETKKALKLVEDLTK